MYRPSKPRKTTIKQSTGLEGERLEQKIMRIMNNKEPISDGSPSIYTERKDGVIPDHNIRTDRFEHAIDAMGAIQKSNVAKREMGIGERAFDNMTKEQQQEFMTKYPNNQKTLQQKAKGNEGNQGT